MLNDSELRKAFEQWMDNEGGYLASKWEACLLGAFWSSDQLSKLQQENELLRQMFTPLSILCESAYIGLTLEEYDSAINRGIEALANVCCPVLHSHDGELDAPTES